MLPSSIRPTVSETTITRVTRLFNGSPTDILNELLQNARRAGATFVQVDYATAGDVTHLIVSDNGCGIEDPARLLALGSSEWSEDTTRREDPAGMGVFALAGKNVEIISRHTSQAQGWSLLVPAEGWTGEIELEPEPATHTIGTTIIVELPAEREGKLARAVEDAARFYPIPIRLLDRELPRSDFLAGALNIVEWNKSRIGIFAGYSDSSTRTVNFHGLTVARTLARLSESRGQRTYHAKLDIGDTPALQLVLPARKEFVENDTLRKLHEACEKAIYATIAMRGPHRLSFQQWTRARQLGIDMPEAAAILPYWQPAESDNDIRLVDRPESTVDDNTILVDDFEPYIAQPLAHALAGHPLRPRLAEPHPAYKGYAWYDALPVLTHPRFHARTGETEIVIGAGQPDPPLKTHLKADAIELRFDIARGAERTGHATPAIVAFGCDDDIWFDTIEHLRIAWTGDTLTPDDLVDLLEKVAFCPSDDSGADSWETQYDYFLREARSLATEILLGKDAAICDQFRDAIARLGWLIPKGRTLRITAAGGEAISVHLDPPQAS